ncbi:MAG: hypothetical protein J6M90_04410 [Oscillospiraceae bacterium]|nr:hypothetical protein [Oscillospiraceae bacterium]
MKNSDGTYTITQSGSNSYVVEAAGAGQGYHAAGSYTVTAEQMKTIADYFGFDVSDVPMNSSGGGSSSGGSNSGGTSSGEGSTSGAVSGGGVTVPSTVTSGTGVYSTTVNSNGTMTAELGYSQYNKQECVFSTDSNGNVVMTINGNKWDMGIDRDVFDLNSGNTFVLTDAQKASLTATYGITF